MYKPKLNQPDVEPTTTTLYSDSAKNITHPEIEPNDIGITNVHIHRHNPTLEEVKKEWETRDYIWKETEHDIKLISKKPTYYLKIRIFKKEKTYQGIITFEEHLLLTKTFRALRRY